MANLLPPGDDICSQPVFVATEGDLEGILAHKDAMRNLTKRRPGARERGERGR